MIRRRLLGLPLPIWGGVLSCLSMMVGWHWDIQWHRCIGRDTVWTMPHVAIYIALALAFIYTAAMVLTHTFGEDRDQPALKVLGFRGPAGAFVTLWGILLQFTSIMFDNWWHDIYGLDVTVFSPPHALLAWGITFFYFGQFMIVVRFRNAALSEGGDGFRWSALFVWAFFLGHLTIAVDPLYGPMAVRTHAFTISSALTFPVGLVLIQSYMGWKWAGAACGAAYMATMIAMMQLFQLFPASPEFGPVYHPVESFFPPLFPLVLVVPGAAIGIVAARRAGLSKVKTALMLAVTFVLVFNLVNWFFAGVITSPLGANRFFAGHFPASAFEEFPRPAAYVGIDLWTVVSLSLAFLIASLTSWVALHAGQWLRRVVR